MMRAMTATLWMAVIPNLCPAQEPTPTGSAASPIGEQITVGRTCSYFGETLPEQITSFESDSEARQVIQKIVNASGLVQNFQILAAGVPNAAAIIRGAQRFILYSQHFVRETKRQTGNEWAPTSIMAHEIGHHLNGHTLEVGGSRPKIELEADYYSGFVLQRMGATLEDARVAMDRLGSATESATHPAKHDRLAAITSGWTKACEADPRCSSMVPQPEPAKPKKKDTANSCEYARDGECDEPNVCEPGTDTADCERRPKPSRSARTETQALPSYCCTPVGRLGPYPNPGPNGIGVPEGGPCYGTHPFFGMQTGQACF